MSEPNKPNEPNKQDELAELNKSSELCSLIDSTSSNTLPELKPIHTACRKCIFAQMDESGTTQTDCRLGRIEKYRQIDSSLILEAKDDEEEFYVINGRYCHMHRHRDKEKNKKYLEMTPEEIYKELSICWGVIILFEQENLSSLDKTLESIEQSSLAPHQVFFSGGKLKNIKECNDYIWDRLGNKVTWRMMQYADMPGIHEKIQMAAERFDKKVTYYSVFHAPCEIPVDFARKLSDMVLVDLERIAALEPYTSYDKGGNGFTISTRVTRQTSIGGHYSVVYDEKVEGPETGGSQGTERTERTTTTGTGTMLTDPIDKLRYFGGDEGILPVRLFWNI